MSNIDDVLTCFANDGVAIRDTDAEMIESARTELAALRRRAEDAEAIVRAIFDADLNADHPLDWYFDGDGKIQFPGRFVLDFDRATGLPILTDEAREALK